MDTTEDNKYKALEAGNQEKSLRDQCEEVIEHPFQSSLNQCEDGIEHPFQSSLNQLYMKILQEMYSYCILEETVSGMHLALGKPRHASQMNV